MSCRLKNYYLFIFYVLAVRISPSFPNVLKPTLLAYSFASLTSLCVVLGTEPRSLHLDKYPANEELCPLPSPLPSPSLNFNKCGSLAAFP